MYWSPSRIEKNGRALSVLFLRYRPEIHLLACLVCAHDHPHLAGHYPLPPCTAAFNRSWSYQWAAAGCMHCMQQRRSLLVQLPYARRLSQLSMGRCELAQGLKLHDLDICMAALGWHMSQCKLLWETFPRRESIAGSLAQPLQQAPSPPPAPRQVTSRMVLRLKRACWPMVSSEAE